MATTTADQNALATGRTFVWHELRTTNTESAIKFYTEALGFGTESMDMGPMGTYEMLTRNGHPICGVMGNEETEMSNSAPQWSTYLSVDDVDARITKCTELGAKLIVPPMDVPTVGRMALIQDPQGAQIWLFKSESQAEVL